MGMIYCPECKKEISSEASSCPKCGYNVGGLSDEEKAQLIERYLKGSNPNTTAYSILSCIFGILSFLSIISPTFPTTFFITLIFLVTAIATSRRAAKKNDCNIYWGIGLIFILITIVFTIAGILDLFLK